MANVQVLLTNGILCMGELVDQPEESFTSEFVVDFEGFVPYCDVIPGSEGNNACSSR
jgi:hypothetical protein